MNLGDLWGYSEVALTIAQLTLYVGCPVAGGTYIAARLLLQAAAKEGVKLIIVAAVAGVVATSCAYMLGGKDGGDDSSGALTEPSKNPNPVDPRKCSIVFEIENGKPLLRLDGQELTQEELKTRLEKRANEPDLKIVELEMRVPSNQYGDWWLFLNFEMREFVLRLNKKLEFLLKTDDIGNK